MNVNLFKDKSNIIYSEYESWNAADLVISQNPCVMDEYREKNKCEVKRERIYSKKVSASSVSGIFKLF